MSDLTGSEPLAEVLEGLRSGSSWSNVTFDREFPPREGNFAPLPGDLHPRLKKNLLREGIADLYRHQREVWDRLREDRDVVIATPTASGKSLAFHLPVLDGLLRDDRATALYLFPTKALARDQHDGLVRLWPGSGADIGVYDGDTPSSARGRAKARARIIITNPDMLHAGLLPHHPGWHRFFSGLRHVVIDEVHQYRGIFGSHVANVLRRLRRVCRFAGSSPLFVCSSATIANPVELTALLTERKPELVHESGAPRAPKNFIFYNPPLVDRERGIREGKLMETVALAMPFLSARLKGIIFARSRLEMEVILTCLKKAMAGEGLDERTVRGYRGGYLPADRRAIEKEIREGSTACVVSTTALELGVDIGELDFCLISGYPGTVAGTYQQAGRAGRRGMGSAVFLVAENSPLDQYIVNHPEYFFGQPPEKATLSPNNPHLLSSHLACAAFELPLAAGESFGEGGYSASEDLSLDGILHRSGDRWHWMGQRYPAAQVSLRNSASGTVDIVEVDSGKQIGAVDTASAPFLLHERAIYLHEGLSYLIEGLDMEGTVARARLTDAGYFTEPMMDSDVAVTECFRRDDRGGLTLGQGSVEVITRVSGFYRIRHFTHEIIGQERIAAPSSRMETASCWLLFPNRGDAALPDRRVVRAVAHLLTKMAPLYVLCDARDIRGSCRMGGGGEAATVLHIFDNYPGGGGFSEKIYEHFTTLCRAACALPVDCLCRAGCPSCLGPELASLKGGKDAALSFLHWILTQLVSDDEQNP